MQNLEGYSLLTISLALLVAGSTYGVFSSSDFGIIPAHAQLDDPTEIKIGISINGISKIDREHGEYDVFFSLWLSTRDSSNDFTKHPPEFNFVNGENVKLIKNTTLPQGYNADFSGTFSNEFDYEEFPFEQLELPVIIEMENTPIEKIKLILSRGQFSLDPYFQGYVFHEDMSSTQITEYKYPQQHVYSRLISEAVLQKPPLPTFFEFVFPVILITFLAIMIFWLPLESFNKLELNAIFLVSVVFYTQLIQFENSFISIFTTFDTIVTSSYVIFLVTIIFPAITLKFEKTENHEEKIKKLTKISRIVLIAVSIIVISRSLMTLI